jgi:nucleoid DNA-binding protein
MAYDVASSINELLFEKNSVIIPGFGGFELQQQPANIDHIKSLISPPKKAPSFNKNLTINDGVLVDYIQRQNNCTLDQADKIVKDFVAEVEAKIEKKEIVEFPKVGRIYKDYNKALQFLPYDTNFNADAFGLPTIEIHPFSRSESVKKETATTAAASLELTNAPSKAVKVKTPTFEETTLASKQTPEKIQVAGIPVGKSKGFFKWAQMTLPLLLVASVTLIVFSYFMLRGKDSKTADGAQTVNLAAMDDDKNVNVKPPYSINDSETTELPQDSDVENGQRLEDDIAAGNSTSAEVDNPIKEEESSSMARENTSSDNECIVIVGQFGSKKNIDKMIQKIESDGYESYQGWSAEKDLTTVGVKFPFTSEREKERTLRTLRSKYHANAWVLGD